MLDVQDIYEIILDIGPCEEYEINRHICPRCKLYDTAVYDEDETDDYEKTFHVEEILEDPELFAQLFEILDDDYR